MSSMIPEGALKALRLDPFFMDGRKTSLPKEAFRGSVCHLDEGLVPTPAKFSVDTNGGSTDKF
jgi:hypothetical protein